MARQDSWMIWMCVSCTKSSQGSHPEHSHTFAMAAQLISTSLQRLCRDAPLTERDACSVQARELPPNHQLRSCRMSKLKQNAILGACWACWTYFVWNFLEFSIAELLSGMNQNEPLNVPGQSRVYFIAGYGISQAHFKHQCLLLSTGLGWEAEGNRRRLLGMQQLPSRGLSKRTPRQELQALEIFGVSSFAHQFSNSVGSFGSLPLGQQASWRSCIYIYFFLKLFYFL